MALQGNLRRKPGTCPRSHPQVFDETWQYNPSQGSPKSHQEKWGDRGPRTHWKLKSLGCVTRKTSPATTRKGCKALRAKRVFGSSPCQLVATWMCLIPLEVSNQDAVCEAKSPCERLRNPPKAPGAKKGEVRSILGNFECVFCEGACWSPCSGLLNGKPKAPYVETQQLIQAMWVGHKGCTRPHQSQVL